MHPPENVCPSAASAIFSAFSIRASRFRCCIRKCLPSGAIYNPQLGFDPGHAIIKLSMLQATQKSASQIAHSSCNPRIYKTAADLIDRVTQQIAHIGRTLQAFRLYISRKNSSLLAPRNSASAPCLPALLGFGWRMEEAKAIVVKGVRLAPLSIWLLVLTFLGFGHILPLTT